MLHGDEVGLAVSNIKAWTPAIRSSIGHTLMAIRIRDLFFFSAPFFFLAAQVLKYHNAPWELLPDSTIGFQQLGVTGGLVVTFQLVGALLLVSVSLISLSEHSEEIPVVLKLTIFSFFVICTIWCVATCAMNGVDSLTYRTGTPLVYLSLVSISLGFDNDLVRLVGKTVTCLLPIYFVLFGIEFFRIQSTMGWIVIGSSAVMTYFVTSFWLVAMYIAIAEFTGNANSALVFLCCMFLCVMAVLLRSRSWVIQSAALLLIYSLASARNALDGLVKAVALVAVVFAALAILINLFPEYFGALIDKVGQDNRSEQLQNVFDQIPLETWLIGGGIDAKYYFNGYMTGAIDNQFLYICYHWGLLFAVLFFGPLSFAVIKSTMFTLRGHRELLFVSVLLAFWLFALLGLSIYNTLTFNVQMFFIPLFTGLVYSYIRSNCCMEG